MRRASPIRNENAARSSDPCLGRKSMIPLLRAVASPYLLVIGLGLSLAGSVSPLAAAQGEPSRRTATRRTRVLKRTWRGLPASTPPQTEVVPLAPLPPAPAGSPSLDSPDEQPQAATAYEPVAAADGPNAAAEQAPTDAVNPPSHSNPAAGERLRTREELERLRHDADARRSFYDDLRRTVDLVRAGARNEDSPESSPAPPEKDSPNAPAGPSKPATSTSSHSEAADPAVPQVSWQTGPWRGPRYIPARSSVDGRQQKYQQQ
jgi:hypothetical protein